MATELPTAGYEDLRDHAQTAWDYVELVDDADAVVTRFQISTDTRASWVTNGNVRELTVTVKGSDADITTPVTIVESRLFDVSTGGSALSADTFTGATLDADGDELTITHKLEIPNQP